MRQIDNLATALQRSPVELAHRMLKTEEVCHSRFGVETSALHAALSSVERSAGAHLKNSQMDSRLHRALKRSRFDALRDPRRGGTPEGVE